MLVLSHFRDANRDPVGWKKLEGDDDRFRIAFLG
jgi:hypothetical protein